MCVVILQCDVCADSVMRCCVLMMQCGLGADGVMRCVLEMVNVSWVLMM